MNILYLHHSWKTLSAMSDRIVYIWVILSLFLLFLSLDNVKKWSKLNLFEMNYCDQHVASHTDCIDRNRKNCTLHQQVATLVQSLWLGAVWHNSPISRLVTDSSWHTDIPAPFFPPHYPLPGFTSFRHREPGVHVWDPGESVCGDGEAPWRHAGDDSLQWKGETSWEAHQVSDHTGDLLIVCRL